MGKRVEQTPQQRTCADGKKAHKKIFNITHHQGTAN